MNKYCLPPPANIGQLFPECGRELAQLPMDEFVRRIPQVSTVRESKAVRFHKPCLIL